MSVLADARTVMQLVARPIRGETHAERLEGFYKGQAEHYDGFRERLLQGRRELCQQLPLEPGAHWLDLGAGTGANLEPVAQKVSSLRRVTLVDLSPSLLQIAQRRITRQGWNNVHSIAADATTFQPAEPADVVTFSYSLTMIPDWFAAIDNALRALKPGGTLGVADFYVSRKYAVESRSRHRWLTRTFWPTWFGFDNVFLNPDLLPYLESRLETVSLTESRSRIPYFPMGRVPYFVFLGRRKG